MSLLWQAHQRRKDKYIKNESGGVVGRGLGWPIHFHFHVSQFIFIFMSDLARLGIHLECVQNFADCRQLAPGQDRLKENDPEQYAVK